MTKKHPGMIRIRCHNITCAKFFYTFDRGQHYCQTCINKRQDAHRELFSRGRDPHQPMTDHDRDELLKQIPF